VVEKVEGGEIVKLEDENRAVLVLATIFRRNRRSDYVTPDPVI
jgi:hypothetical protein